MLPAAHRLCSSSDFTAVLRNGRRAGRPTLTVHYLPPTLPPTLAPDLAPVARREAPARAGLVVSKAVGGSVVRHQVARRLRHALQVPVGTLPAGARLVVRAAPSAATATYPQLAQDLASALARVSRA